MHWTCIAGALARLSGFCGECDTLLISPKPLSTPALREGGYVIDFWGLGYDIAEGMGLIEDINRIGYDVREVRIIVGDHGQRASLVSKPKFSMSLPMDAL
jgi:hypothetical protein